MSEINTMVAMHESTEKATGVSTCVKTNLVRSVFETATKVRKEKAHTTSDVGDSSRAPMLRRRSAAARARRRLSLVVHVSKWPVTKVAGQRWVEFNEGSTH